MDPGLYITFFKEGESRDHELPPVGPLEHVVYREGGLLADRKSAHQVDDSDRAGGSRWIEAELELQRAIGNEPGGTRRPCMRVAAKEGVFLRFASFGESVENNPAPELGPYAVVTIGPKGVEADGELLAIPTGSKRALWDLTATAGKDLAGVVRPDIAFRSEWSAYHPGMRTARPEPTKASTADSALRSPVVAPMSVAAQHRREPVRIGERPPQPTPRPAPAAGARSTESAASGSSRGMTTAKLPAAQTAQYLAPPMTLLDRVSTNTRASSAADGYGPQSSQGLQWGDALWRMRFVVIGVLVLFVAVFGSVSFLNKASGPSFNVVGVGATIKGVRWDYTVNNISRTTTAGEATARGIYLVIRVGVRNQGAQGAALLPSEFAVVDSTGTEYPSLPESAIAYQSDQNTSSPYVWPHDYPVGQFATAPVIFELPSSVRGLQLAIRSVPSTRVRLD